MRIGFTKVGPGFLQKCPGSQQKKRTQEGTERASTIKQSSCYDSGGLKGVGNRAKKFKWRREKTASP